MKQEITANISQHIIISKDKDTVFSKQYQAYSIFKLIDGQGMPSSTKGSCAR